MLSILKGAWQDLSAPGRATVIVVLILAVAGLLAMAMWLDRLSARLASQPA